MPAPQAPVMQNLAKLKFQGFALKLPTDWRQPQGIGGAQYAQAMMETRATVGIPMPMPPALFLPASMTKYHCDTAKKISDDFTKYIDGICSAICSAWSEWQSMAAMTGVVIIGPLASVGQVVGPPLMPLIMKSAPKMTPMELKFSNAIATAISNGWLAYTATIKIPSLPFYPAFAAFPGPLAPPMPNIPVPVIALTQVTASISKDALKSMMIGLLADPRAQHHVELFDCVADAFDKCFKIWQASTMVTNVLGTGPIPTFAPPVVPAGPVVGGTGNMTPGGFV
jgi:hypothetical protein